MYDLKPVRPSSSIGLSPRVSTLLASFVGGLATVAGGLNAIVSRRVIAGAAGRGKYFNKRTEVSGKSFQSKREATRYTQLLLLARNGEVRNLRCQVTYRIEINGKLVCKYIADFVFEELRADLWSEVVEDVKGFRTDIYRLKKKLMQAVHNIEVRET